MSPSVDEDTLSDLLLIVKPKHLVFTLIIFYLFFASSFFTKTIQGEALVLEYSWSASKCAAALWCESPLANQCLS